MKIEDRVESDHHPVTVQVKGGGRKERKKENKVKRGKKGMWTEEGSKKFEEYFGRREDAEGGWKRIGEV